MATASEVQVEVVSNRQIAPEYFSMRLVGPRYLARFRPGQFLMLGCTDGLDPLLPRALSIRSVKTPPNPPLSKGGTGGFKGHGGIWRAGPAPDTDPGCEVEILYKVCGRGTALLATMRPGRSLRALGPLGNGFEVPRSATEVFLVAGGIGVPPIAALAEGLATRRASRETKMTVFLGGRSKADLLCTVDFKRVGAKIHVATEDGSAGQKGLVTELLEQYLNTSHPKSASSPLYKRGVGGIYACGPHPMLAALATIAEKYELPYQASMEASMACGFGACMGCVVPVKGGEQDLSASQAGRTYRLVCKDGPVFDGYDILWP
ncbi:dihydroorotate dehydrogenase electron transfer subunit [Candidatus Methylomirabilis limnetica]|uniref:Dihydroorotate dehydrogenase B (NAD(+)), electron transfer subunit n=1 Tax=Candidatus Methylomirabilis limnetica TaxID=2033718 RepID=A0A2T4TWW5_9BACT|nr:dihydroorotate dehydrogenase electron transfer subunit [Candidatus Methylomirabilis limnetica]PTL35587.1 dihydroorotate dehydrogenase electron transfer subunit [Candidatus Methylomirabilis limnetica]